MAFSYGSIKPVPGLLSARVVISKKICSKAVDRNRLRRRIRAIVREFRAGKPAGIAVYPNKKAADASFRELQQAFAEVLK